MTELQAKRYIARLQKKFPNPRVAREFNVDKKGGAKMWRKIAMVGIVFFFAAVWRVPGMSQVFMFGPFDTLNDCNTALVVMQTTTGLTNGLCMDSAHIKM